MQYFISFARYTFVTVEIEPAKVQCQMPLCDPGIDGDLKLTYSFLGHRVDYFETIMRHV